ncbi:MAG: ATPase, T2SS/T4P/T4SS family [Bacteriovoracia bacterium]
MLIRIETKNEVVREVTVKKPNILLGNRLTQWDDTASEVEHEVQQIELQYPTISKKHALLRIRNSQVEIQDLESKNGTWVENKKLVPHQWVRWTENQKIRIGPLFISFIDTLETEEEISKEIIHSCANHYLSILKNGPTAPIEILENKLRDLPKSKVQQVIHKLQLELHGNGPLEPYISSSSCKEIVINSFDSIFVDTGQGLNKIKEVFISPDTYEAWAKRVANDAGRRLDLQNPICEASLPNGARFHAVLPPASYPSLSVCIRRFGSAPIEENTALQTQWMSPAALEILRNAVREKKNIVISGGTSTGKTSLLNFLCQYFDPNDRIITIEDTLELTPPITNLSRLQSRKANADGIGELTLRHLVQSSLRMRPDRILLGECRGPEVLDLLQVFNTGHPGSMTTVHANTTKEALSRLELLALLGAPNLSILAVQTWVRSSIDLVVQVERSPQGKRFVKSILKLDEKEGVSIYENSTL